MSSSTTLLSLSFISTASASALNSNLMDTKNNNNENDTYSYIASLRKIEERYQCTDYIKIKESKDKHIIDGNCRARVCRWMFDIVDSLNMSRDTAVAAICNLDRFMCATKKATFDRKEYQLGKYVLSSHLEEQAQMYQYLKLLFYRVLTHSTFILPLHIILFVSYSSKHHCNSYCNQSLRVKRGRCLSTKSTLSWIAVCKRYRTIRA